MKITEKVLIDNLTGHALVGFISSIDGENRYWDYAYHDGEGFYFTDSETRACYIGHSRNGNDWTFIDAFHVRDPRRAEVIAERKEVLG